MRVWPARHASRSTLVRAKRQGGLPRGEVVAGCDAVFSGSCDPVWSAECPGLAASENLPHTRKGALEVSVMTIAVEERRVRNLFERVETVEDVACSLAEDDERRARLLEVSNSELTARPLSGLS